ncbi:site-specific DNA-methyltransferase, partial [candidate division KSB3 bacterium]|nr:site-specific DNA-methyltransferase [candidate division KSB3 bacterium]MBD3326089.1 site-specific DNA-methyltransferase [candidate division KSB3 bacterium]
MNRLYFGDNLVILKQLYAEHPHGFIDLIYIDPPFNSKRNYNILYEDVDMTDTKAQKEAFADTWSQISYLDTLREIQDIDLALYQVLTVLEKTSLPKGAVSYLCTMAIRIWYMHKVLKETGSFYLHCDPTMSHYLKMVCDMIFDVEHFRSEITWKRTSAHSSANRPGPVHDVILMYSKSGNYVWNKLYQPYDETYLHNFYRHTDPDGRRFRISDLTGSGKRQGATGKEWKGINPTNKGRHWMCPPEE